MAVYAGQIIEIEVKAKYNKPSPTQRKWLTETSQAGGYAWCIWGDRAQELEWLAEQLNIIAAGGKATGLKLERLPAGGTHE